MTPNILSLGDTVLRKSIPSFQFIRHNRNNQDTFQKYLKNNSQNVSQELILLLETFFSNQLIS